MRNLLFIYNNPFDGSYGGSQGTRKAFNGLEQLFNLIPYSCMKKSNKIATLIRNTCGYSGNLSFFDCKKILKTIKQKKIEIIYFDVSLHGRLVYKIKQKYPKIPIVVNYHNCEAQYFKDMYKANGILFYPIFRSAVKNEKLSKKYADFHILITEEDRINLGIEKNYTIIPVTLDDSFKNDIMQNVDIPYILFLGAAQYANIEGARFIIEKIAPFVNKQFIIAGKGMKTIFNKHYKNVEIYDYIPSLSEIYSKASAFISPLFSGSGAKVKIAEALMYGKKIIGTSLSFYGYDMTLAEKCICESQEEFIKEINKVDMSKKYYADNRELFLSKYDSRLNKNYYSVILKFLDV